jgi:hypothetical protein
MLTNSPPPPPSLTAAKPAAAAAALLIFSIFSIFSIFFDHFFKNCSMFFCHYRFPVLDQNLKFVEFKSQYYARVIVNTAVVTASHQ